MIYFNLINNQLNTIVLENNIKYIINNIGIKQHYIRICDDIRFMFFINTIDYSNISLNIIEKYYYIWNYYKLSQNSNITEEFILKFPYQYWNIEYLIQNNKITNFKKLSYFKYLTYNIIIKYLNKPWDFEYIIYNKNKNNNKSNIKMSVTIYDKEISVSFDCNQNCNIEYCDICFTQYIDINILNNNIKITDTTFENLINLNLINYKNLSNYINIAVELINKYPNKPWDWDKILFKLFDNYNYYHLGLIEKISSHKKITMNIIIKYKNNWNYWELSKNPNITKKFILEHPDKDWDIDYLIINKILKINEIKNYNKSFLIKLNKNIIYKKRQYDYLNITEEFILKYPNNTDWDIDYLIKNNKIIDFKALSKFTNINQKIIDKYSDKPWDWEWIIENTSINVEECISMDLIKKYKEKWNYWYLSRNSNLTEEFILKHFNKDWNIKYLQEINKFKNNCMILENYKNTLSKLKWIDNIYLKYSLDIIENWENIVKKFFYKYKQLEYR